MSPKTTLHWLTLTHHTTTPPPHHHTTTTLPQEQRLARPSGLVGRLGTRAEQQEVGQHCIDMKLDHKKQKHVL